jgi:ABC-type nitrate/sulfonate/bicarbonate transport system permease component
VLAEEAGSSHGLGYLLTTTGPNLEIAEGYAAAVILCVFAMLLFALLTVAERFALPWAYHQGR